ncbi:MAG: class I SAM-dependent methyltransferase [Planctomycetota bacterium]|jgi:ubiquinone/menaquinone biosynthesis C-methylase UbiE
MSRAAILLVLITTTLCTAAAPPAAPPRRGISPPPIPDAPGVYMGRTVAQTMHYAGAPWLVRESRDREEDCTTLLEQLAVTPGMSLCDMGCGNGFYTIPLAKLTGPTGRVFAVDIQQPMLDMLSDNAKAAGVSNIEPLLGTYVDPGLAEKSVDLMLLVDVYHEMSHPEQMLAAMRKALKPDGRLVLLEFRAEDPKVPIKPLHKMTKAQILKEYEANGFELVKAYDGLPWQHMMWFGPSQREQPDGEEG